MDFASIFNNFWSTTGVTLIKTFAIIVLGLLLIKIIMRYVKKVFMASQMEAGLSSFLLSVIRAVLYVLLIFLIFSTLGVSMGAFIAALSAAGLAVALALQDSLSNLASGILILVNKPFVEGDYIRVGTDEGTVKSVRIFTTQIESYDKKIITIPNKAVINSNVVNYTSSPTRRVTILFCVPYNSEIDYIKSVIQNEFKTCKYAIKSPEMFIGIENYNDHGVQMTFKIWSKSEDYWGLYYLAYEKLTRALKDAGITITNDHSIINISDTERRLKENETRKAIYESKLKAQKQNEEKSPKTQQIEKQVEKEEKTQNFETKITTVEENADILEEKPKKKRKFLWGRKNDEEN